MSLVNISSKEQFSSLLGEYEFLVADFYADWCGPCKVIAPAYEQLAQNLSSPGHMVFTKINVDEQQDIAKAYGITAMPTFIIFKKGRSLSTVRGADPRKLNEVVRKLGSEADKAKTVRGGESSGKTESGNDRWLGAPIPEKQSDISNEYDPTGLELLNCGNKYGEPKVLFDTSKPSALSSAGEGEGKKDAEDWVESETDEQLMLYVRFMSSLRIGMLQLTSLPPSSDDGATRPKTIRLFANRSQILGFDEAEETIPVQEVTIQPEDYDPKTGTASVELRYVDFPNVTSLVFYFVDSYGTTDKVRVDRIRIMGKAGDSRDKGPLEKIGDETSE